MKIRMLSLAAIVLAAAVSGQAEAKDNNDACGAILCLVGEAMGQGGGRACTPYLAKYFAIQVFHHGFSASRTASARRDFLNQCSSGDPAQKSLIDSRYGSKRDGP
ncbi:hypothetical protein BVER_05674c [Candidatus Burkholderia verschuerenii]|uniref:IncN plasmid KikA protein n=1 Tax=Candidatus Burkholderia verschuerenii TaxID=242163 RepID=A0A0L0MF69_9BURK|nr:TrbM/KikA/MpfK family conjugal transfer protein [Candidatus Burkholderia verschuerenii]KND60589.1 hypothetical protein BVER_05674c [Candidatus Burkholderia verschuerenii]